MINTVPEVFVFESSIFGLGPDALETPPGYDIAQFIYSALMSFGNNDIQLEPVVQAIDGWEIGIHVQSRFFIVLVHWVPGDRNQSCLWAAQIAEPSFIRNLFGMKTRKNFLFLVRTMLNDVLGDKKEIVGGRWVTEAQFREIY